MGARLVATLMLMGIAAAGNTAVTAERHATAHDPQFENKAVWPSLTGKEYFLGQSWPKGRLYVWAHPGEGGGPRVRGGLEVTDPNNWLLDGKPADELILDENTDLLFPASEERYSVGFRGTDIREVCRHITVESGAGFVGGGDGRGRQIYGNVWVKEGGKIYAQGATNFLGDKDSFFRNDNVDPNPNNEREVDLHRCSQYFTFNKDKGVSVEFRGHVTVLDEFRIFGSTVIVGRDSSLQPGRNARPMMAQSGILALLDGAYFGSWCNNWGIPDMTVENGTIQGGLPDRPLTRNATFGLGFKNHTAAYYENPRVNDDHRALRKWKGWLARVPSLHVQEGALRSYSTDLKKARLVFSVMPGGVGDRTGLHVRPLPGSEDEKKQLEREPEAVEIYRWFDALPRGIDCYLGKDVVVDGVEFDHLRKGGLICESPVTRDRMENVFFGPNCKTEGAALYSRVQNIDKRSSVY